MGQLGNKRNNQLAENGLLFDAAGNKFDLTQWYIDNSPQKSSQEFVINYSILKTLEKIETHLSLISGEELNQTDPQQEDG